MKLEARGALFLVCAAACAKPLMNASVDSKSPPPARIAPASAALEDGAAPEGDVVVVEVDAVAMSAPVANLDAYCRGAQTECAPGSAVLCGCTIETVDASAATITVRNSERFETDADFRMAALRAADGWHVSQGGVKGHSGAETHYGFTRTLVRLEKILARDVVDGDALENVFWFVRTEEDTPPGAPHPSSTFDDVLIVCGSPPEFWCTEPIEVSWPTTTSTNTAIRRPIDVVKDIRGRMVVVGESAPGQRTIAHSIRVTR